MIKQYFNFTDSDFAEGVLLVQLMYLAFTRRRPSESLATVWVVFS